MVDHLGSEFDFLIVTSDRDATDSYPYPNISVNAWNSVGKANVCYVPPQRRTLRFLAQLMRETPHDILYLNSFFDPVFTLQPLLARRLGLIPNRPTLIAPRGEFSQGALALKRWKKKPYLSIAKKLGLYRHLFWQASSRYEAEDIRCSMGRAVSARKIHIAPNLPSICCFQKDHARSRTQQNYLRVVFLSRITPMKNLDFAMKVLPRVSVPVKFDIYGPIRDQTYWEQCQKITAMMPEHVSVRYHGAITNDRVLTTLSEYDLFFLPTAGENYGHAILEAMMAGLPVLISDQTPWRNLETQGLGWDLSLDEPERFVRAIEQEAQLPPDQRLMRKRRIKKQAANYVMNSEAVNQNRIMFLEISRSAT
ncbi:Glycosyltransferase involved in cell wall bisynthesis [Desulfacinum hydrothermale DSM 13146]|uniref:Glycosyltransferase involved in cell wall bisynthesis n=1 Tax=Desulfacinum hydrothermale DSM 13146 TaxID=1121390 RepID=A0A1W1XT34_9BACT|nr:glycosyltransferase [Desulfacinum hydrothermale]SMC26711.1 Glycosyltransferase involved in cell wall bisynthesis [Desulfacinum hydrothermale DSM 13146]